MHWIILAMGILFEVLGTVAMKYAEGFTKLVPSVLVFVFYALALGALVMVLKKMEVGIAYSIWAGAGTALIAVMGMIWFKESVSLPKIVSIVLIIAGIVGLEFFE